MPLRKDPAYRFICETVEDKSSFEAIMSTRLDTRTQRVRHACAFWLTEHEYQQRSQRCPKHNRRLICLRMPRQKRSRWHVLICDVEARGGAEADQKLISDSMKKSEG
jgi:hypothetical protein